MNPKNSGRPEERCLAVLTALTNAVAPEELAAGELSHAEACTDCGALLARQRELAVVTSRTRRALEQTRPTLDAQAWERIRSAVERDANRSVWARVGDLWHERRSWFVGAFAVAAVALVVLALRAPTVAQTNRQGLELAKKSAGPNATLRTGGQRPAEVEKAAPIVAEAKPEPSVIVAPPETSVVAVVEGGAVLALSEGASLSATTSARTFTLYGRHVIEVAQGASVQVVRLSALGIRLEVERGTATFEVKRAAGEAPFRVAAGDVTVEVRGTVFSVGRRATDVTVSVERGRVAVMRSGQAAQDEVEVAAGERVIFPTLEPEARHVTQGTSKRRDVERPKPERMVEVEVGHKAMKDPSVRTAEGPEVSNLIPPILGAVRAGRCVQALNALDQISQAVDGKLPRRAIWLTAYCQRQLGNLERSRGLFARYGSEGPWALPSGDELPPLP